ncbi:MAG: hypothetical protein HZA91_01095 [Verrucomicrobia bacterium]|nr:hypothetical protein [Verrucomicrobiota bacterium]
MNLDDKQKRLISAWINYGKAENRDYYARFISLWVAFNAVCYARYATLANRYRADLRQDKGLTSITYQPQQLTGTVVNEDDRIRLQIEEPGRIVVTISRRYTEDIIFSRFAEEFQPDYVRWLFDGAFEAAVLEFREALSKHGHYYVINMARVDEHTERGDYNTMKRRHVIYAFENPKELSKLKDVLYQVRCNVFHGEKIPGDLNDDRIVRAACPVLLRILQEVAPGGAS